MVSDSVLAALIGVAGTVVGAIATIMVARIQASQKAGHSAPPGKAVTTPVLGEAVDLRELRILRALFGEPKGRLLEAYKDKYYRSSLEATIKKGWVKQIQGRYFMTSKGAAFCEAYLKQLLGVWQPATQVLA